MKNCIRCGTGNVDEATFCSLCGAPFAADIDEAPVEPGEPWEGADYTDYTDYYEGAGHQYESTPQYKTPQYEIQMERRVRTILIRVGAVLVALLLVMTPVLAWRFFRRIPDPVPSGDKPAKIDIMSEPVQVGIENVQPFRNELNNSTAAPCASYTISAKVLGVYINTGYGDREGAMPIDLALIWGTPAKTDYDKYMKYGFDKLWKHNQWLQVRPGDNPLPPGIEVSYLMNHISNNHIFPANENIYYAVAHLKKGEEVMLSGYLVNVTDALGNRMLTSTSRTDTDAGACECFYVDRVQYGGMVYK